MNSMDGLPKSGPGKFEGGYRVDAYVWGSSLDGSDIDFGSIDEFGEFYACCRAPLWVDDDANLTDPEKDFLRSVGGGAIVREDQYGFVDVRYFDTQEDFNLAIEELGEEFASEED